MTWYDRQNDSRLQVFKGNPYHDAHTGRFTSKDTASLASGAKANAAGIREGHNNPTGLKARPGGKSLPSRAPVTIQSAQEVLASHGYSMGDPHVDLKTGMTTYTVTDQKGNSQAVSAKNLRTFLDSLKAGVAAKPKITPKNVPTSPSTFTSRALRGVRRAVSNYFDLSDTTDL